MKKFWKTANFRLKAGLIITCFFMIVGFIVYLIPHTDPFSFNTYPNNLGASGEHWLGTTSMEFLSVCLPVLRAVPWTEYL